MEMGEVHPATEKLAIRSHLALLCRSLHCADSLVLYLNSPAASDGTMLLWDGNRNGIVSGEQSREGWEIRGGPILEAGAVMGYLRRTNPTSILWQLSLLP